MGCFLMKSSSFVNALHEYQILKSSSELNLNKSHDETFDTVFPTVDILKVPI